MHSHNECIINYTFTCLPHINDQDVPKPREKDGRTKKHDEVLEPLWTTRDILDHQDADETNNDELDLNGDTG